MAEAHGSETRADAGERDYSSLGRRFCAALIDNGIWLMLYVSFVGPAVVELESSDEAAAAVVIAFLSLWFNYFSLCEWRWGQTIGKSVTRIRVVPLSGEGLGFGATSMRNLLRLIDWLLIGWLLIATGSRKQRLGDMVAGTVVVPAREPAPVSARAAASAAPPGFSGEVHAAGAETFDAPGEVPARPGEIPTATGTAPLVPPGEDERPSGEPPQNSGRSRGTLPEIPWKLGNTVRGLFAGLLLGALIPILVLPFDPELQSDGALLAAQGLFGLTLLVFPLGNASGWSFEGLRLAPARLGLRGFALSGFGWMLVAMVAYYVFAGLFAALFVEPQQDDIAADLGVGDENLLVAVAAVVLIVGLAPIAEEAFFRGFFFSGLRSRMSLWPAALLSGLAFGMVHVTTGITTVVPLAAFGVALAWLYEKTGSLWPPVIVHMVNNAIALAFVT